MGYKMKIAILICGHLRTWEHCKQNFIDNFLDENHEITVIVNTYTSIDVDDVWHFPTIPFTEYSVNENLIKTEEEIKEYFSGIPNIIFKIVKEERVDNSRCEEPRKVFDTYQILESLNQEFDIVVRTRFDLKINKKIDYNSVFTALQKNNKLLILSHTNSYNFRRDLNHHFAMSTYETMQLYFRRDINLFTEEQMVGRCLGHDTLELLTLYFGVEREWEFYNTSLIRDRYGCYMKNNPQFLNSPFKVITDTCVELW